MKQSKFHRRLVDSVSTSSVAIATGSSGQRMRRNSEPHQPIDAWSMQGGGRIWVVIDNTPKPGNLGDSIEMHPWTGPAKPCNDPHYIDLRVEPVGWNYWMILRVRAWPEDALTTPKRIRPEHQTVCLTKVDEGIAVVTVSGDTYGDINVGNLVWRKIGYKVGRSPSMNNRPG